ncbi:Splicing factor 45 [Geranomyces michiganensis]|nr:Splicing factor 45 [Geranomyces michiganensis]
MASLYAALDAAKSGADKPSPANELAAGDAAVEAKKVVVPAGWSATQRLLQPAHIRRKPPPAQPKPRTVLKDAAKWAQASASLATPLAAAPSPALARPEPDVVDRRGALVDLGDPTQLQRVRRPGRGNFDEIYEPAKPNDYHHLKQEAKRRKQEQREPQRFREERHDNIPRPIFDRPAPAPAPPAPPSVSAEAASGEEAYLRRMRMANPEPSQQPLPTRPPPVRDPPPPRPPSPTMNPQRQMQTQPNPALQTQQNQASVFAAPLDYASKVVLLKNMVGSDGVDDDLQTETADECKRFGAVQRCVVYEVPYQAPDHEAVRIFVAFSAVASARKAQFLTAASAQAELNGRFFGGRAVIASFYDEKRFQQGHYED